MRWIPFERHRLLIDVPIGLAATVVTVVGIAANGDPADPGHGLPIGVDADTGDVAATRVQVPLAMAPLRVAGLAVAVDGRAVDVVVEIGAPGEDVVDLVVGVVRRGDPSPELCPPLDDGPGALGIGLSNSYR